MNDLDPMWILITVLLSLYSLATLITHLVIFLNYTDFYRCFHKWQYNSDVDENGYQWKKCIKCNKLLKENPEK